MCTVGVGVGVRETICVCMPIKEKFRSKHPMPSMFSQLGNLMISLPSEPRFKMTKKGSCRGEADAETEKKEKKGDWLYIEVRLFLV